MVESARLAALKYLCTYLETEISIANEYRHDLAGNVFRGRLTFGESDPLPRLSFLEGLNPDREPITAGMGRTAQRDSWIVLIQGQVADNPIHPTDPAHELLADVKAALGKLRKQMIDTPLYGTAFNIITDIEIEPGTVRPPDDLTNKAFFWMRVVLKTAEEMDDPYWRP